MPIESEVRRSGGRSVLHLNGRAVLPIFYALTDVPGGRWSWEELPAHNIAAFARAGIRLVQVDLFLQHVWPAEGVFPLEPAARQVRGVLDACPEAAVFLRFHVNAPGWWLAAHPEERTEYGAAAPCPELDEGLARILEADPRNPLRASLASRAWLAAAQEALGRFCERFAATEEGEAVAGIQPACGVYGEWHYWGFLRHETDTGGPMTEHFRRWLVERYGSVERLRAAWSDLDARFETAAVPSDEEVRGPSSSLFRDLGRERRVVDYYRCRQELVADDIIAFCRMVKEQWPRPIVTGAFYGYFFSLFNRQAAGGHLALHRVLASDAVDYLAGPQAYYPESEKPGDPYRSRGLIDTIRLHGKLWLDEYDQEPARTFRYLGGTTDNRVGHEAALARNVAGIVRSGAFAPLKGGGLWFYDFGPAGMHLNHDGDHSSQAGTGGYWDHPRYLGAVSSLARVLSGAFARPYRSAADGGARELVRSSVAAGGRHLLWVYAPGYHDGARCGIDRCRDLTGLHIGCVGGARDPEVLYESGGGFELPAREPAHPHSDRVEGFVDPLLHVADPRFTALGRYAEGGEAAFGLQEMGDHTAWFAGLPPTSPDVLRAVFAAAGAHVYSREGDIVYSGSGILAVHTAVGGDRRVALRGGRVVEIRLPPGPATVLLDAESGTVLLGPE